MQNDAGDVKCVNVARKCCKYKILLARTKKRTPFVEKDAKRKPLPLFFFWCVVFFWGLYPIL